MAQPPLFPDIQAIYSELIPPPPPLKFLNSPSAPLFLPDYTKCLLLTNRFHHRAPGDIDFHMVLNSVFTGRIKSGNGFKDNISPLHFYIDFPKLRFQGRREYAFRIFTRKNSWFAVPMRLVENIQPAGKTEEEAWRFADELGSTRSAFDPDSVITFQLPLHVDHVLSSYIDPTDITTIGGERWIRTLEGFAEMRHRVTLRICAQYAGPNLLGRITAFRNAAKVQHELRNQITPWDAEEEIESISPQSASETERSDEGSHNPSDVQSFQSREQSIDDEKNELLVPNGIVNDSEPASRYRVRKRDIAVKKVKATLKKIVKTVKRKIKSMQP